MILKDKHATVDHNLSADTNGLCQYGKIKAEVFFALSTVMNKETEFTEGSTFTFGLPLLVNKKTSRPSLGQFTILKTVEMKTNQTIYSPTLEKQSHGFLFLLCLVKPKLPKLVLP